MSHSQATLSEKRSLKHDFNQKLNKLVRQHADSSSLEEKCKLTHDIRELIQSKPSDVLICLSENRLIDLDLSGLDLSGAEFFCSTIRNVKFNESNLSAAVFSGRDRASRAEVQADFTGADCKQADF